MISNSLQDALNKQIVSEIYSANLYLSMSFYFEKEGFDGFSTWMKKQSAEEMDHAYQMANYLIKRGGEAVVGQIPAVKQTWTAPLDASQTFRAFVRRLGRLKTKSGRPPLRRSPVSVDYGDDVLFPLGKRPFVL